jgi:predicted Kef-type K+ transport protein
MCCSRLLLAGVPPGCSSSRFGFPIGTAVLVGLGLTQIGEFSYVLVGVSRSAGLVRDEVYSATLAASLITIVVNTQLLQFVPRWIPVGWRVGDEIDQVRATLASSTEPTATR